MIVEFRRICNRDSMRTGISLQINTQIVFIERPNNNKKKHFQVLFISSNAFNPWKRRWILSVNCNLNNEESEDISSDKVKRFQELLW